VDDLRTFEYSAQHARLLQVDARVKLAAVVLLSLALLNGGPAVLALASLLMALHWIRAPRLWRSLWSGLRWLTPLLGLVVIARALTDPAGPDLNLGPLRLSGTGIMEGTAFAWRLVLVIVLGSILTTTTAPSAIKAAVTWYLKPVPLVPAARVGTMLSLLLRFIPLIFSQAGQTLDAQRARAVEHRKNPLYRLRCFILPFFRRTLLTADRVAEAMEARCYSDLRTAPQSTFTIRDGLFLCAVLALTGLLF